MSKKLRIDLLLVEREHAPSRERAQSLIMAGKVLVNDQAVRKASERFDPEHAKIRLKGKDHPFVGRGGVKLSEALKYFQINPQGKICVDIGASTGGFTDCLLQSGAKRVYTFDSGTNQLAYALRENDQVICRENFNARELCRRDIPETIDLVVMDVSFISICTIIPALLTAIPGPWQGVFLVKPQFEAGKGNIQKGGIVRDPKIIAQVLETTKNFCEQQDLEVLNSVAAAITGAKGNQEYFIFLQN